MEAVEQGRSTELTSRYEANGILTAASDAIVLDLIREGGNRTGEAIVGLVFRRTRKDRLEESTTQPFVRLGYPVVDPARLVRELSTAQQQIVSAARDSPMLYGSSWWPNSPPCSTLTGEAVTLMTGGSEHVSPDRTTPRRTGARSPRTTPHRRNRTPGSHSPFR
ncbi:hypothetical protein GCM10022403_095320 [Streptomyces coacervatus]|uniref:Uncharacterized protein n=1 Tax=Streptomyces coacervatus TaxID=647381 RepID=A0ABP7JND9_9ACTN